MEQNKSKLRAVGYSRTSGEGQRDNTSIPSQKTEIERFSAFNDWDFVRHYVDESKSGAKVDGRDDFKRMMKDAVNGEFDLVVIYDISRFARDGCDILNNAKLLNKTFGVNVVDTKGTFDIRRVTNTLLNFVVAGVSEHERINILDRTLKGRIANAKNNLPWTGSFPVGRSFKWTIKNKSGDWFINEKGKKLRDALERYAKGESLTTLAKELGLNCRQTITSALRLGQLSGIYHAPISCKELARELSIPVPAIPEIITPELEQKVRERLTHHKICNKEDQRKYLLTGFVFCSECGVALTCQKTTNNSYYRHRKSSNCSYCGIGVDLLENQVLDYLYNFFLDEPAYNKAIETASPSNDDRLALENDIVQANSRLLKVNNNISNLVNAVMEGGDVGLLRDKQDELKAQKKALEMRINELNQTLTTMPNIEHIKQNAMYLRIQLMEEYKGKDWRKLDYNDVRSFLHFLFSDNPRKSGYGIFVSQKKNRWNITFKGCAQFNHDVIEGRPLAHILQKEGERLNIAIKKGYNDEIKKIELDNRTLKPKMGNLFAYAG